MLTLFVYLRNWLAEREGQDLIEYAIMVALVAVVGAIAYTGISGNIKTIWTDVSTVVAAAVP